MRILNDEEIVKVYSGSETSFAADDPIRYGKAVARAQHQQDLKDFVEWGEKDCDEHPYSSRLKSEEFNRKRHRCFECWESLK